MLFNQKQTLIILYLMVYITRQVFLTLRIFNYTLKMVIY